MAYITKSGGAVAIARAKALLKVMVDNNAELTIILPADITEMEGVIAKDYKIEQITSMNGANLNHTMIHQVKS